MDAKTTLEQKLNAFISKYYKNQLLRGGIFFFAIGLSYFLVVLLIEYFLWLRPLARTFMFWSFVAVELILLYRFVLIPLARLFKLQKGIDFTDASMLIGAHFPEVSDKLLNTLQLKTRQDLNELALAGIAQKSRELEPVPFSLAIDYRKNSRFLKFAGIPVLIGLIINFFYDAPVLESSYNRMVNYDTAYEPPAPFEFIVITDKLEGIENRDFNIQVVTRGKIIPQNAQIAIDGASYYMKNEGSGKFSYVLERPTKDVNFSITANDVRSRDYTLKIIKAPVITQFNVQLDYPSYTGRKDETIANTGNLIIPEGTVVSWNLDTQSTTEISWITKDSTITFLPSGENKYSLKKAFTRSIAYSIATSNTSLRDYERLDYSLDVIKDALPKIEISTKTDTVNGLQVYHQGEASDDYGLSALRLIYYRENAPEEKTIKNISFATSRVSQFIAAFPDTLNLVEGETYSYYFEVLDNDAINGFKSARSNLFVYNKLTKDALADEQLKQQRQSLNNLDQSIKKMDAQELDLEQLSMAQKEKEALSFSEQQQLKNALERQKEEGKNLQTNADQLRKNLEDFNKQNPDKNAVNEELQERLKQNEERLKEQEKMLDELNELRDKIDKEELNELLEKLSKQNTNSKKSLKQLLELTKRYYVDQKMKRIVSDIKELSRKQEQLATEDQADELKKQQELSNRFKEAEKALDELEQENQQLKKPMDLPKDVPLQEAIKKDQKQAEQELEKSAADDEKQMDKNQDSSPEQRQAQKAASPKQQKASEKMKQLAQQMQEGMMQNGAQTLEEDVAMLRQILDNLLLFSFRQEDLMKDFKAIDDNNPVYSKKLVSQQALKENFEHVDDSLFALSLRSPFLKEDINKQLTEVDYNMGQALDRLAENRISQGTASQQYIITGANTLADMLSSILNNMQQQLSGSSGSSGAPMPGQGGQGAGKQLSDIILSQEQLAKQMGKGSSGEGDSGKEGKKGQGAEGKDGKEGTDGKEGKKGKNGQGQDGQNGSDGSTPGDGNTNSGLSEQQQLEQYEIYKQQQEIRQKLQDIIEQQGLGIEAVNLVKDMEELENKMLDGSFNSDSKNQLANIIHELLKLKNAAQEQGMENKRESTVNTKQFENISNSVIPEASKYFKVKEILNREPLPLNGDYKSRVKNYFSTTND